MSHGSSSPRDGAFQPGAPLPTGKLSAEDLVTLNEEIAGMAKAGLPLDQGLSAIAHEMGHGRLQQVTRQLADDMTAGHTLPEALERQGERVPPYYSALLAAGIRSGRLSEVLATLTVYARSVAEFREMITSALLYPATVAVLGLGLLLFVSITIVPAFADIFAEMKMKLPWITQVLFVFGRYCVPIIVVPLVAIIIAVLIQRWWLQRTPRGRVIWARLVYSLPIVGTLLRSARMSAFTDLLGILVDQAIPLPEAIRLASAASSDPLVTAGADAVEGDLKEGIPFGEALRRHRLMPDLVVWLIAFGEKRGTLGAALHHVAAMYRRHTETRAALLRNVLPSLVIIVVACTFAALFLFGLIAPFVALMEELAGGFFR